MVTTNLQTKYANTDQFTSLNNIAEPKITSRSSSTVDTEDAKSTDSTDDTTMDPSEFFLHRSSFSDEIAGMTALGCGAHNGMNTPITHQTISAADTVVSEKTTPITADELEVMKKMYELLSEVEGEIAHKTMESILARAAEEIDEVEVEAALVSDINATVETKEKEVPDETLAVRGVVALAAGSAALALNGSAEAEKMGEEEGCYDIDTAGVVDVEKTPVDEVVAAVEFVDMTVVSDFDDAALGGGAETAVVEADGEVNVKEVVEEPKTDVAEELEGELDEAAVVETVVDIAEQKSDEDSADKTIAVDVRADDEPERVVAEVVNGVIASVIDESAVGYVVDEIGAVHDEIEDCAAGDGDVDDISVTKQELIERNEAETDDVVEVSESTESDDSVSKEPVREELAHDTIAANEELSENDEEDVETAETRESSVVKVAVEDAAVEKESEVTVAKKDVSDEAVEIGTEEAGQVGSELDVEVVQDVQEISAAVTTSEEIFATEPNVDHVEINQSQVAEVEVEEPVPNSLSSSEVVSNTPAIVASLAAGASVAAGAVLVVQMRSTPENVENKGVVVSDEEDIDAFEDAVEFSQGEYPAVQEASVDSIENSVEEVVAGEENADDESEEVVAEVVNDVIASVAVVDDTIPEAEPLEDGSAEDTIAVDESVEVGAEQTGSEIVADSVLDESEVVADSETAVEEIETEVPESDAVIEGDVDEISTEHMTEQETPDVDEAVIEEVEASMSTRSEPCDSAGEKQVGEEIDDNTDEVTETSVETLESKVAVVETAETQQTGVVEVSVEDAVAEEESEVTVAKEDVSEEAVENDTEVDQVVSELDQDVQKISAAVATSEEIVETEAEVDHGEFDQPSVIEIEDEVPVTDSKSSSDVASDMPAIVASLAAGACVAAGAVAVAQMSSTPEKVDNEDSVPSEEVNIATAVETFEEAAPAEVLVVEGDAVVANSTDVIDEALPVAEVVPIAAVSIDASVGPAEKEEAEVESSDDVVQEETLTVPVATERVVEEDPTMAAEEEVKQDTEAMYVGNDVTSDMPQIVASLAIGSCAAAAAIQETDGEPEEATNTTDVPVEDEIPAGEEIVFTDSEEVVIDEMIDTTVEEVLSMTSADEQRDSLSLEVDEAAEAVESAEVHSAVEELLVAVESVESVTEDAASEAIAAEVPIVEETVTNDAFDGVTTVEPVAEAEEEVEPTVEPVIVETAENAVKDGEGGTGSDETETVVAEPEAEETVKAHEVPKAPSSGGWFKNLMFRKKSTPKAAKAEPIQTTDATETAACIHVDVEDESPVPEDVSVAIGQEGSAVIPQDHELPVDQEAAMETVAEHQKDASQTVNDTESTEQLKTQSSDTDSSDETKPEAAVEELSTDIAEENQKVDVVAVEAVESVAEAAVVDGDNLEAVEETTTATIKGSVVEPVNEMAVTKPAVEIAESAKTEPAKLETVEVAEAVEPAMDVTVESKLVEDASETTDAVDAVETDVIEAAIDAAVEETTIKNEDVVVEKSVPDVAEQEPAVESSVDESVSTEEAADDDLPEVIAPERSEQSVAVVVNEVEATKPTAEKTREEVAVETKPVVEEIAVEVAIETEPVAEEAVEEVTAKSESGNAGKVTTLEVEEVDQAGTGVVEVTDEEDVEVLSNEAETEAEIAVGTEVTLPEDIAAADVVEEAGDKSEDEAGLAKQAPKEKETSDTIETEVAIETVADPKQEVEEEAEDTVVAAVEGPDATPATLEVTEDELKPVEPPASAEPSPVKTVEDADINEDEHESVKSPSVAEAIPETVEITHDELEPVESTPAVVPVEAIEVDSTAVEITEEEIKTVEPTPASEAAPAVVETATAAVEVPEEELATVDSTPSEATPVETVAEVAEEELKPFESSATSDAAPVETVEGGSATVEVNEEEPKRVESSAASEAAPVETVAAAVAVVEKEVKPVESTPTVAPVEAAVPVKEESNSIKTASPPAIESEEKKSPESEQKFEVDTKPISAVSMLIGRFEHFAKRNAEEAANLRISSRVSSRVSSPIPSPPSTFPSGNVFETAAKNIETDKLVEDPHVESIKEEAETNVGAEEESLKIEETVDESLASEATTEIEVAKIPVEVENEAATAETEEVAQEEATTTSEIEYIAEVSAVDEAEVENSPEREVEAEPAIEETAGVDEAPVAVGEVTEVERTTTEEAVEEAAAAEIEMTETTAESETETIKQETTTEDETAEEVNAAQGRPKAVETVDEVPVAEESVVEEVIEAAVETTRETQTITTAYEATETSILSVDTPEDDALRNDEVDTPAPEGAKEAELAVQAPLKNDNPAMVATADFTTNETVEAYVPVHEERVPTEDPELGRQIEEDPSDLASATKETHAAHEESKESHDAGDNQKEEPESTQRSMSSIFPEAPTVQTDDAAVTDEDTAKFTVEMALTSQATKAVADDTTVVERTPERDSTQLLPHEQMTYEILGVTRANNVIMYHIYTVNSATSERSMSIPKRYSEFKLLDEQLRALDFPSARDLPVLPKPSVASFLRGRRSKKTIEMREKAFGDFLHYITKHDELHECAVFQQFIAN